MDALCDEPDQPNDEIDNQAEEEEIRFRAAVNDKYTDTPFLMMYGLLFLTLVCLLGYFITVNQSGEEDCGSMCNEESTNYNIICRSDCLSQDMSDLPPLKVDPANSMCSANCDCNYVVIGRRCLPKQDQIPKEHRPQHEFKGFVLFFVMLIIFTVAYCFFNVYTMTIYTVNNCFNDGYDMNDYTSQGVSDFMGGCKIFPAPEANLEGRLNERVIIKN